MEAWSTCATWKGKSAGTAALVHVPSDPISPESSALISNVQTDTASTCPALEGGGEESLHELDQSDEVPIRPRKILWFLLLTIEYAGFAALTLRFFPQNWGSANHWVEHILTFVLHVVYMDLILNWLTGLLLHRISWLRTNLHRSEHAMIKEGKLHHLMQVAFFYGLWTLLHMVAFGLGIACTSPSNHSGCWNWQSTMWVASFAYSLIGLLLRFWFWFAQGSADMCTGSPMMLNLALFYWAHFNPESEWEDEVVFGSVTPFWDVLFGTCPYDIKFSVPIPFLDFALQDSKVFVNLKKPKDIRWTMLQQMWYAMWVAALIGLLVLLSLLQAVGYFK